MYIYITFVAQHVVVLIILYTFAQQSPSLEVTVGHRL